MNAYDRCRCRPGCLATLRIDDEVVLLQDGYALAQHVDANRVYPQLPLPIDIEAC